MATIFYFNGKLKPDKTINTQSITLTMTDILSYMTQSDNDDIYSHAIDYVNDLYYIIINTITFTDELTRNQYESIMNYLEEIA